jgi:hypothetical protein
MKITYSVWQGSIIKGTGFVATNMKDVAKVIDDLNSTGAKPKFEYFVSKVEQETK